MLISIILLITAYIHCNRVKNSKNKSTRDLASRLVVAAWIFFAVELIFLVLVVAYRRPINMMLAAAFPMIAFLTSQSNMTRGEYVGNRLNYFQPPSNVSGGRPP